MKIALDIGGSNIRLMYHDLLGIERVRRIASRTQTISPAEPTKFNTPNLAEDFIITSSPFAELNRRRFIKNEACKAYTGVDIQIDNQSLKIEQTLTKVNVIYAIAVLKLRKPDLFEKGFTSGIAIPAKEFYNEAKAEAFKNSFIGEYTVYFPAMDKTVKFQIEKDKIKLAAEGVIALTPHYEENKTLLRTSSGVVFDVGRRSSDITPVVNYVPVGSSASSSPRAGLDIEAYVSSELQSEGIFVNQGELEEIIQSGKVRGTQQEFRDVGYIVQRAKEVLASRLLEELTRVLSVVPMSIRELKWIAAPGRAFAVNNEPGQSYYTGSLLAELKKGLPDNIVVIEVEDSELANARGVLYALTKKRRK